MVMRQYLPALLRCGAVLLFANEIRGAVLAAPVLFALWQSGGTLMAFWLAFCSLAGIGLSVAVPLYVARRLARQTR